MYYKLKKDSYIRQYGNYGYITSTGLFSDRLVDHSGLAFLQVLTRDAQTLDMLVKKICQLFKNADYNQVLIDAAEFYNDLASNGFIASGKTLEELDLYDQGFSYQKIRSDNHMGYTYSSFENLTPNTQEFLEKHFQENPQIVSFQIELTSRCNERCIHCYIPHENKLFDIKPELYYSVLEQLEKMGTFGLTLSGGEPLLHPQFKEFLIAAKEKDFYISVLSNLTLLTEEIIEAMKYKNKCSVQISLYSMIPEHHDAITTIPGSFEKTKKAILRLIENDIPVQISCPTLSVNKDDYKSVLKWAHGNNVRAITDFSIMAKYNHDTGNLTSRLSPVETESVILQILEEDEEYRERILGEDFIAQMENFTIDPEAPLCGVGISSCCMVANGNVYPCSGWQDYVCGNLYQNTLDEIWRDSQEFRYLRSLRKKDLEECLTCDNRAFCKPCMVRNFNESQNKDPLEINRHFCDVAAINKKVVYEWRRKYMNKEKDVELISNLIIENIKKYDIRADQALSEQIIAQQILGNIDLEKRSLFNEAVDKLSQEGILKLDDEKHSGRLILTMKGEKTIYKNMQF